MNIKISQPYCYSAIGKKPNQEDSLFPCKGKATQDTFVFLVCDGMGGHENGEVASACVADTIGQLTSGLPQCSTAEMREAFNKALAQAYHNLDALDNSESEKKMGTTLTFLALCTDGVLVAHIGDSRVYQLRPGKGVIFQTRDHSLVNDLIASGELTEDEARNFPQRNVITRAVQPHQEYPAKATYNVLTDLRKGDVFFMCCDGVIEQLDNDDLCRCLLNELPAERRLADVEKECKARGTHDNNTAYLIEVMDVGDDDSVMVGRADDADTMPPQREDKNANKIRIFIVILLFIIIGILASVFLFASSGTDDKGANQQNKHKSEQVQGTITRHRK